MFSKMVEIILEIEFQVHMILTYKVFLEFYFFIVIWIFEKFVKTRLHVWKLKLQKIINKYPIWNPLPTLYMQYLFGLKYDRQLAAWQHHGPKIDPTCFRGCKMGWVPFFIWGFFSKKTTNQIMLQHNFMVSKSNLKLY